MTATAINATAVDEGGMGEVASAAVGPRLRPPDDAKGAPLHGEGGGGRPAPAPLSRWMMSPPNDEASSSASCSASGYASPSSSPPGNPSSPYLLLVPEVHNTALQAPGRAISAALSRLTDKVPDSTFKILTDYNTATITLLALLSAATRDEDDCTSDRILSKRELMESKMPELKGLVLGNTNS